MQTMKRYNLLGLTVTVALVLALALTLLSCGGGSTTTTVGGATTTGVQTGTQVAIKNLTFSPHAVTIKVGENVTWTNEDSVNHTVVANNGEFQSGSLANGDTFTFTFAAAGTFAYHCSVHPSMTGTVVVQ